MRRPGNFVPRHCSQAVHNNCDLHLDDRQCGLPISTHLTGSDEHKKVERRPGIGRKACSDAPSRSSTVMINIQPSLYVQFGYLGSEGTSDQHLGTHHHLHLRHPWLASFLVVYPATIR